MADIITPQKQLPRRKLLSRRVATMACVPDYRVPLLLPPKPVPEPAALPPDESLVPVEPVLPVLPCEPVAPSAGPEPPVPAWVSVVEPPVLVVPVDPDRAFEGDWLVVLEPVLPDP